MSSTNAFLSFQLHKSGISHTIDNLGIIGNCFVEKERSLLILNVRVPSTVELVVNMTK